MTEMVEKLPWNNKMHYLGLRKNTPNTHAPWVCL